MGLPPESVHLFPWPNNEIYTTEIQALVQWQITSTNFLHPLPAYNYVMAEVTVDTQKLVFGLEKGIGRSGTIFSSSPTEWRLRYSPCGLVSSAIAEYLKKQGIPVRQVISTPNLAFDPEMQHVLPIVGESENDPVVIDASFSQFLGYVGISGGYEELSEERAFPDEKVIDFKLSEKDIMVNWLTAVATQFQSRNRRPRDEDNWSIGDGPLVVASASTIRQTYTKIWDPANFTPWESIPRVQRDGRAIAKYIPLRAITLG